MLFQCRSKGQMTPRTHHMLVKSVNYNLTNSVNLYANALLMIKQQGTWWSKSSFVSANFNIIFFWFFFLLGDEWHNNIYINLTTNGCPSPCPLFCFSFCVLHFFILSLSLSLLFIHSPIFSLPESCTWQQCWQMKWPKN